MAQPQKNPLRPLTEEEREVLEQVSRSQSAPASHVARAKALLAVANGQTFTQAAYAAGRRAGDAVAQLVARFNHEGLAALIPRHGGGAQTLYGVAEQERILREARRTPDREQDGTVTWSLTTLQRALRQAEDGLGLATVVKQNAVAGFHGAQVEAGGKVAHTGPGGFAILHEGFPRVGFEFRFNEPVIHAGVKQ